MPIPISGFTTPPDGTVNAQLGLVSYDGSLGKSVDSLSLNGTTLSDPTPGQQLLQQLHHGPRRPR